MAGENTALTMEYKLSKLVEVASLQTLVDFFHQATDIPLSITDPEGSVLAGSGPMEMCDLLRSGPATGRRCTRNDELHVPRAVQGRKYSLEKCWNGLSKTFISVTALGRHIGNFVVGPFLVREPDGAQAGRRARQLGFEKSDYVEALSKVPVVDEAKLRAFLECFCAFTEVLGKAGEKRLTEEMERWKRQVGGASTLEENILSNMKELVLPCIDRLRSAAMSPDQTNTIGVLESSLREITSSVIRKMQTFGLSARESTVASFIKGGKTTAEIAELLGISNRAVEYHRYKIRKKLGLYDRKIGLVEYLSSLD